MSIVRYALLSVFLTNELWGFPHQFLAVNLLFIKHDNQSWYWSLTIVYCWENGCKRPLSVGWNVRHCINCKLSYFNLRVPILSHPCSNTIWCTSGSQQIWHRRGWQCPRTWTCSTGSCMLGPHSSWAVGWWGDHLSMPELKNNEFVCEIDN